MMDESFRSISHRSLCTSRVVLFVCAAISAILTLVYQQSTSLSFSSLRQIILPRVTPPTIESQATGNYSKLNKKSLHEKKHRRLQTVGSIIGYEIYNAINDTKVDTLTNGQIITLSKYGLTSPKDINFVAIIDNPKSVTSVEFVLSGTSLTVKTTEKESPFAVCGNVGNHYFTCPSLRCGATTLQGIPYNGGNAGKKYEITIQIVSSSCINPTLSPRKPTVAPQKPTLSPRKPTSAPRKPTLAPLKPTLAPLKPTLAPLKPTLVPRKPTLTPRKPTSAPRKPTLAPQKPTKAPQNPTLVPRKPTMAPIKPTSAPKNKAKKTMKPKAAPTAVPQQPTFRPSISSQPSQRPSISSQPSHQPSNAPTNICFQSAQELSNAVYEYINNRPGVRSTYGDPIGTWCVSKVTDFTRLFSGQIRFNESIADWDVSNAVKMVEMFNSASKFNQDLSKWNVSRVTNMDFLFAYASSFNSDISRWDVSKVKRMTEMFRGATSFNQDISQWNVGNAVLIGGIFRDAVAFNADISNWNIHPTTDLQYAFAGATSFNQDLSKWDVSDATDFSSMFEGAVSFNKSLCAWGSLLLVKYCSPSYYLFQNMFKNTNCSNKGDPSVTVTPRGPFCTTCT